MSRKNHNVTTGRRLRQGQSPATGGRPHSKKYRRRMRADFARADTLEAFRATHRRRRPTTTEDATR